MKNETLKRFETLRTELPCGDLENAELARAFVHRSYLNEPDALELGLTESNERLEFLGDSVLSTVISRLLYDRFPDVDEGALTTMRARLVNTKTLAALSTQLGLGELLFLGRGESLSGGAENPTILAGTIEALIGVVFVNAGYDAAFTLVTFLFNPLIDVLLARPGHFDHKPKLQEFCQRLFKEDPVYRLVHEEGPPHKKIFEVEAVVAGEVLGAGVAPRKKDAEQAAALEALKALDLRSTEANMAGKDQLDKGK